MKYKVTWQVEVEASTREAAAHEAVHVHATVPIVFAVQKQRADGRWDHKQQVKLGDLK